MKHIPNLPPVGSGLFAALAACFASACALAEDSSSWSYETYDYAETAERGEIKEYRLAIPKGVSTVRGILVVSNCFGGDSRDWYTNGTAYEAFLHLHDFAFIGGHLDCSHFEAYDAFVKALAKWAQESGHPELVNVPYVATGVSAGGGFASTLVTKCPEKTIAAVIQCARLNLTVFELPKYDPKNPVPVPAAVLGTPVLTLNGETEFSAKVMEPPLEEFRPVGALFGWADIPGRGHEYCGQETLAMPYLETALKMRYPSTGDVRVAPLKLNPIDPRSGWVADNTSWKSGLTTISPATDFKGDVKKSSWLLNEDIAHIYRAYSTGDRPLKITSPAAQENIYTPVQAAGSSITIQVDASGFPGWKKLDFYDGARLLGTVTSGATRFVASDLTPGFHAFSVLATDASGTVRTSDAATVAVLPGPATGAHAAGQGATGQPGAGSESLTGTAARTGTFKRPLLIVDGKRYELTASERADPSVAETLVRFSNGDTGSFTVQATRGLVNGVDGLIVERIEPAPASRREQVEESPRVSTTKAGVAASVVSVGPDRYRVYDYDDLKARNYSFVIPEGLETVRGLLVHGCYSGGDSRYDWKDCEYYRQFMHMHGFAYVGSTGSTGPPAGAPQRPPSPVDDSPKARHRAIFDAFEESVPVIAAASRHPELVNAPYAGVGFSAGGGYALNLMVFAPEKTIAAVSYCSPYNFKRRVTEPVSEALLRVPSISITGEEEGFNAPLAPGVDPATGPARIDEVFLPYRPIGGEFAWLEREDLGHAYDANRQDVLGMPFLDAAVRARYPKDGDVTKGPIKLVDIDPADGWIADHTTWKGGLTKIAPATEFQGDLGRSSWLLNEDLAFIYRAYATYDKPLTITSPSPCGPGTLPVDPGADVTITVDAGGFPNWRKLELYDGAKKLGTITEAPTHFTAMNLSPGYHVFSVLGTDDRGMQRTSDPVMLVVRKQAAP